MNFGSTLSFLVRTNKKMDFEEIEVRRDESSLIDMKQYVLYIELLVVSLLIIYILYLCVINACDFYQKISKIMSHRRLRAKKLI